MEIPAPFHVLLIEDSPEDRADIRQMLLRGSQRHYKFTEAETGAAGVRAILDHQDGPPDCVLLDFKLPDMDAFEVLAAMRGGGELTICPVVVVTGTMERGAQVIRAGAQDYVGKGWATPESLTRSIENAVERYDLTGKRQKAYQALRKSEQRLDLGLRVAGVALAEVDYTTGLNHLSAESARQFGLGTTAVAVPRGRVHATSHPDDRAILMPRIAESLDPAGAGWFAMDHRVVWPSGEVRWLRVRKQVTFDGEGRARRPVHAILATLDVTMEKRAEERLRLFEQVVTGINDAVLITEAEPIDDPGPRIVYVNPAFTAMTGYTAEEAIGRSPRFLQGPKSSRAALDKIRAAMEQWQPVTVEVTNYRKDGTEFEVEFSIVPVANEHGWFTHCVSLQRDVSERNRAVSALAQSAALFAKIIEQAPGGVYVIDAQFRVREVNTEALPAFAAVQPVIGREFGEVMEALWGPEIGRETTAHFRRTLETGERYVSPRFESRRHDIGVEQAYEWQTQRLTLPDGQHGVVCYFQDVTASERAAAALRTEVAERKHAEEANRLATSRFELALKGSAIVVFYQDLELRYTWIYNPALGFKTHQLIGKRDSDMMERAEDAAVTEAIKREVIRSGVGRRQEVLIRAQGVNRYYDLQAEPLREADGRITGVQCAAVDITERTQAVEAVKLNAALFAKIIEQAPGGVYVMDAQLRVREVNTEALPVFASVQPVIGRELGEVLETLWGPEIGRETTAHFRRTLETGERYVSPRFESRRHDIGVEQAYEWQTQRLTLPDGQHGVVCYFQDVTASERAAAALRTEVAERKHAEEQVRLLNRNLEQRVADRVGELATKARLLAERNAEVELARVTLEEKAAELARASGYKSEFLANMSHELRTPLNVILLLSQQLAANKPGNLSAKQREFAHLVHSSGTDLLNLINDILDLAKIESGTVTVKVEEVSLARLCDGLTRHFQPVADAKKLTLHATLAGDLPPCLRSDTPRVRQILKNLVANALKFTARGHVEVRVGLATQGWRPDHPVLGQASQVIAFAVEDTGIGIAAHQQRRIFESFQQADATTSRHHGGTGLGLAISRQLAALLGGAITLTSAPGRGSTFTLYLPQKFVGPDRTGEAGEAGDRKIIVEILPRSEPWVDGPDYARQGSVRPFPAEASAGKAQTEVSREILRGRKVLVVDDDVRNVFALTALLENHEFETLSAADGRSAIRLLETTPDVSLVLMDIMMPDMDGYEIIRQLRQSPQFRTLPILALTARAMPGDREKCLKAGASDYLTKPVNSQELIAVMGDWMAR